jgi:DNA-binding winged helix-turn-helix (wHTH) protein/tetratricopeptide (TPR) repeat protein
VVFPTKSSPLPPGSAVLFGPFRLDPAEERLWKGSEEVTLRRKAFALLSYLVANPRRLVTQEELVQAVWGGAAVSESLVRGCVRELRQAIGESVLETVVGRGYRFVGPVVSPEEPMNGRQQQSLAAPSPTGDAGQRGAPSLIGRQAELSRLTASLRRALAGERQIVIVVGEPGIGKTTLLNAFLEGPVASAGALVGAGQCVEQYGTGEAYLPVLQALGALCRGPRGERVTALLGRYAPMWLLQMSGVVADDQLEALHRRVQGATEARMLRELCEALEALSAEEPLVLAFEDLHWLDPSTADVFTLLAQRRERTRLLVIGTSRRSELPAPSHPTNKILSELPARSQAELISLASLGETATAEYLSGRFPQHEFPAGLASALHEITGGIPLFLVAMAEDLESKRLVAKEGERWQLRASLEEIAKQRPECLTQLIDIQIDRLPAAEQRVLEACSVIGVEFAVGLVAAALDTTDEEVDDLCRGLARRRQFLRDAGSEEWPDGTIQARFAVVHALHQRVSAERSAPARRQRWHKKIAARLEAAYGDRVAEIAAEIGMHLERGGDHERAIRHYALAAERASKPFASAGAIGHLVRSLDLLKKLPERSERDHLELRLLMDLGPLLVWKPDAAAVEVRSIYARAIDVATRTGDRERLAGALVGLEFAHLVQASYRDAEEVARRLEETGILREDAGTSVQAAVLRGVIAFLRGDLLMARDLLETVQRTPDPLPGGPPAHAYYPAGNPAITSTALLAECQWILGYPERALATAERGHSLAGSLGLLNPLVYGWIGKAYTCFWRRDAKAALRAAEAAVSVCDDNGFHKSRIEPMLIRLWALRALGEPADELARIEDILAERLADFPVRQTCVAVLVAEICSSMGRAERSLKIIAEALVFAREREELVFEPELHRLRGELLAATDRAEAEACFSKAIELSRARSARSFELRAALSLARLPPRGKPQRRALGPLAEAYAFFTEGFDTADLAEARALLGP